MENDRLIRPEHVAPCDAKKQRVADLAGGSGDCDALG
jgi:hypothetical protein